MFGGEKQEEVKGHVYNEIMAIPSVSPFPPKFPLLFH